MVYTVGPAVGGKAQIGIAEETRWGYPVSPPNKFFEFTGEGIVSEYTNLVSASLRADRAIHKQRTGTEQAAGDVSFELAPAGFGTLFKHALGQKRTKRRDICAILIYVGADTDVTVTIAANAISSAGTTAGDHIDLTLEYTQAELIAALDALDSWVCYAPWGDSTTGVGGGYFSVADKTAAVKIPGTADFTPSGDLTGLVETCTAIEVPAYAADTTHMKFFPIWYNYGIYDHVIDCAADVPQGLTLEVGRDVAAFNYYGGRVNSLSLTVNPGEIVTGTTNLMFKGASTCGDPAVVGSNTGWIAPLCAVRDASGNASSILDINTALDVCTYKTGAGASEVWKFGFSLKRGHHTHDGYYYDVSTVQGFLEFLEYYTGYFNVIRYGGVDGSVATTGLADDTYEPVTTSDQVITMAISATIKPLFRGNYIGTDAGNSGTVYVDVSTGGAIDGAHAVFKGSINGSDWSATTLITNNTWHDILNAAGVDTGFDVMFPGLSTTVLTANDTWSISTFKDEASGATYETEESFTGFQGSVTLDRGDGSGAVAQGIMGFNFTLTNNLYGDKYHIGERQRAALVPQQRTVEGSMSLEFDDLDIYRMFVNQVAGDLTVNLISDEYIGSSSVHYGLVLRFPNIKYSGTTPVAGGPDIITTDYPFNALYDDDASIPELRMTLTNNTAHI